jgi:hypothetical protein
MSFQYSPKIVTEGLVLYLDAANTKSYPSSGTVWSDLSRSGNNGTLINGPTFDSANGGSIIFDGVNDYGVLNINSGLNASNISLCVTAKIPPQNNASLLFLFNRSDYLCVGNFTGSIVGPPNGESFSMVKANPANQVSTVRGGEHRFTDDLYHDFVYTKQGNAERFYVDGILVGSFTSSQPIASQLYPIEIGQRINAAFFRQLTSSTYRIYNRELTAAEVLQNYNATKGRFGLI